MSNKSGKCLNNLQSPINRISNPDYSKGRGAEILRMRHNDAFMTAACIVGNWEMLRLIAGHVIVHVWFGAQTFVVGARKRGSLFFVGR